MRSEKQGYCDVKKMLTVKTEENKKEVKYKLGKLTTE